MNFLAYSRVPMSAPIDEIIEFQIRVSHGWLNEGLAVGARPSFEFVAYFSAVNALYWLWGVLDGQQAFTTEERAHVEELLQAAPKELRSKILGRLGGLRNEAALMQALVGKFHPETAKRIVAEHEGYLRFLVEERRRPIHRMDARSVSNGNGDPSEGQKYLRWLSAPDSDASKKLKALAGVLYLIRCNLIHGSKVAHVEDGGLVGRSVPLLRSIAEASLEYTQLSLRPA